ncbi:MAG: N2,N2-dimethylguanosine tRNA methyltransferase [Cyanobacteria bacterium M_DeepCast_200m_mx_001]|nr:N2,N2-dimethylguanosine tRNA methyltransferase [Cyanobacteria bacterium M_DeepCast_200m_mx_001]
MADTATQTQGGAGPDRPLDPHYCEGQARLRLGQGFFRPQSRPSRDLGVLLARQLPQPLEVLDLMAGSGIRALRYGLEAGAAAVWANDADGDRLPLLQANLAPLAAAGCAVRTTVLTGQKLLADCLLQERRFALLDLDAFGCPTALVAPALEALQFGGVLYLASTDGRSPTGHDRGAALRSLGAAARAHPASWELALRLQIGVVARAAWALGRGVTPLFSFSEGRTFRVALQLQRRADPQQERLLGMLAHCHGCGEQFSQSLWQLRRWPACGCGSEAPPLAISGPLWLGPLQHGPTLEAMVAEAEVEAEALPGGAVAPASLRLLRRLLADPGLPVRCWPVAELARRLGGGPPATEALLMALRAEGFTALRSGVMEASFRCNAPWPRVMELAAALNR